eukprot:1858028-Amphidinium_carterae.2
MGDLAYSAASLTGNSHVVMSCKLTLDKAISESEKAQGTYAELQTPMELVPSSDELSIELEVLRMRTPTRLSQAAFYFGLLRAPKNLVCLCAPAGAEQGLTGLGPETSTISDQ